MEGQTAFERAMAQMTAYSEWLDEQEEKSFNAQHWGVWHPNKGWWFEAGGKLFFTTHRSVAKAQRDVVQHWGSVPEGKEMYRVRCIEEWADERQD